MIDIRQSDQYANYLRDIGWIVKRKSGVNYFIRTLSLQAPLIRRFPPCLRRQVIGSVLKIQRPEKIDYRYIDVLVVKYRVFQIVAEPKLSPDAISKNNHNLLYSNNFKQSKSPYLPTKTLHLDLNVPEQKLFNNLKKDCKYAIKINKELSVMNCELGQLEEFRRAWKKSVGWKRYVPPLSHLIALKKSFCQNCLFVLHYDISKHRSNTVISGTIFLKTKHVAYYWQAFTNKAGRKAQIQYKIVWEGIRWAKKSGCKIFDFEGIYDERFPNKSWLGFSHFKKSFGGKEVEYPGCYIKFRLPL